jgi:hypothetical protein
VDSQWTRFLFWLQSGLILPFLVGSVRPILYLDRVYTPSIRNYRVRHTMYFTLSTSQLSSTLVYIPRMPYYHNLVLITPSPMYESSLALTPLLPLLPRIG